MILSEIKLGVTMKISSNLGLRNIDQDYDWFSDVRHNYLDFDLSDIFNFIQQAYNISLDDKNLDITYVIDCQILNDKQLIIFCQIESYYVNLLINPDQIESLRLIVIGTADTDKSYMIKMVQNHF